jgi:diaminopimelate decarboxylase
MASNYNLVGRPPLVGVAGGEASVLVRRETIEDVLHRDLG